MATWREVMAASGLPAGEAQVLAAHAAGQPRSWVVAHADDVAAVSAAGIAGAAFKRRGSGEPIAYIVGEREFFSLMLQVTPAVLIPRPETEQLVEQVLLRLPHGGRLLDIGTGSGAVAIAVAAQRQDAEIWAADISTAALEVAGANAACHGARIRFVQSDLLAEIPGEKFDVIASNPPYVAEGDDHLGLGDLRFEPRSALVAGSDGLACIRRIAQDACSALNPGGWLLLEHGFDQGTACMALLAARGYHGVRDYPDLAGQSRICEGNWGRTANEEAVSGEPE